MQVRDLHGRDRRRTRISSALSASRRRAGHRGKTAAITAINTATPNRMATAVVGVRSPLIVYPFWSNCPEACSIPYATG